MGEVATPSEQNHVAEAEDEAGEGEDSVSEDSVSLGSASVRPKSTTSLRRSVSNPTHGPISGAADFVRNRADSIGSESKGSGSGTSACSDPEIREFQVIMRRHRKLVNGTCDETGSVDSGEKRDQELLRRRSASVLEVKERAHSRLREELLKAQQELKLKDEQCQELAKVQDQMGVELEDLTASLFEEANKMVQDAHVRRMQSEKLLKEANAKIEVLQAEVTALKTLVITSTPSMPNRHLHPQISAKIKKAIKEGPGEFIRGHRRSTSHHNFTKDISPSSSEIEFTAPPHVEPEVLPDDREVDPIQFEEFRKWREKPTLDRSAPFLATVVQEEILPCLTFTNDELANSVFKCVLSNTLMIEPVPEKSPFPRKCALTETMRPCKYRIKLDEADPCHFISQLARNRIAAVCDFFTYVRYITQGLVKSESSDMYWETLRLRKQMALAKLGLS